MYRVSALVQYSFDVEAPFMSFTNFLLVVGLSQQQFDQTLGVDPHSSSSFDQTSLVLAFSVSCRQTMWGFLSLTFTQFSEIFKFRDNTTFLELWLKRKKFVIQEDFPMKRTMKTMDHETMVTNSDYRQ